MIRLILFGIFLVIITNKRQLDAARELYTESLSRIRPLAININSGKSNPLSNPRNRSPTFMQSRRFHSDQLKRDNRDLNQPPSFTAQITSSYYYSYGGLGADLASSSQEACRLTNSFCSRDYQCCSGKCRCVKWSIMGKTSCWKKCY